MRAGIAEIRLRIVVDGRTRPNHEDIDHEIGQNWQEDAPCPRKTAHVLLALAASIAAPIGVFAASLARIATRSDRAMEQRTDALDAVTNAVDDLDAELVELLANG